jgi:uncharacterized protein (TIGR04255 family)
MLARFARNTATEYPTAEETYEISVQLQVAARGQKPEAKQEQTFTGYKLTGRDAADLILLGPDRIATVRLAPYCGWDNFIKKVRNNYDVLRKLAGYRRLTRVATRYINRLDIPSGQVPLITTEDYLLVEPKVPKIIPRINFFSTNFVGVVPEIDAQVIVRTGTVQSPLVDHVSLLLDIDLFKEQNLPSRDREIWDVLNILRTQKNKLFEAFITDRSRELFERA